MNSEHPTSFFGLGIAPDLMQRLDTLKFSVPTPIQYKAIPIGIAGEDLIGIAQTGTGKTLAFAIPIMQRIPIAKKRALVITPTRELAIQVDETFRKVGGPLGLKTAVLIGGESIQPQIRQIKSNPHVIIATPGRLIDHLQQKTLSLFTFGMLVLDEADRMLDMGFEPQIKKILAMMPSERQTMLFSATMPEKIAKIARSYMKTPLRIEVAPSGTTIEKVEQEVFIIPKVQKIDLLEKILSEYHGTILVFSRTKHGAKRIARQVNDMGHRAAEIHSNRSLSQRQEALSGFKSGKYRVLVATDIAARGIDVIGIEVVINFDLPDNSEDYVHRIGRTGRAGNAGKAISFACPEQKADIVAIERLIRISLPISPLPEMPRNPHWNQNASFSPERNRSDERNPHGGGRKFTSPRTHHARRSFKSSSRRWQ